MGTKAFLGMGLLGKGFVQAMAARGEVVRAWNRTAAKMETLRDIPQITICTDPAEAVKDVQRIHLTLKDDASVDEVLNLALPGMEKGAVIIDHTTTTREGAINRTREWKEKGFTYQHAPVFMGPANALEASGVMLVSGEQAIVNMLEPELQRMTGKLVNLGEETGKAAAYKLAGNAFLVCFSFSLRETLAVADALDLRTEDLFHLFSFWNPGKQLEGRLKRMTSGDLSKPSWELAMARKDTGLFLQALKDKGSAGDLLPVIAAVMDQWIEKGFGNYDWTIVGGRFKV